MTGRVGTIAAAEPREIVTVGGRVVSIEVQPRNAAPTLTARISDGTGAIDAVFLGRRDIPGVTPGAHITVSGCVTAAQTAPRLFNPRFEIN